MGPRWETVVWEHMQELADVCAWGCWVSLWGVGVLVGVREVSEYVWG